jgi:hypothetical protein
MLPERTCRTQFSGSRSSKRARDSPARRSTSGLLTAHSRRKSRLARAPLAGSSNQLTIGSTSRSRPAGKVCGAPVWRDGVLALLIARQQPWPAKGGPFCWPSQFAPFPGAPRFVQARPVQYQSGGVT